MCNYCCKEYSQNKLLQFLTKRTIHKNNIKFIRFSSPEILSLIWFFGAVLPLTFWYWTIFIVECCLYVLTCRCIIRTFISLYYTANQFHHFFIHYKIFKYYNNLISSDSCQFFNSSISLKMHLTIDQSKLLFHHSQPNRSLDTNPAGRCESKMNLIQPNYNSLTKQGTIY